MSAHSKQRTEQHLIDENAQRLLKAAIPNHWVLRDYRPDYGLDYSLEVFRGIIGEASAKEETQFETLGEHLFIQLKGCKKAKRQLLKLYARHNVEKSNLHEDKEELVGKIEVIPFSLEVSELLTVQRMGAALPVLLVVAESETDNCFFLCLNDYIDKVLVPKHGDYTSAKTRTIHIPTRNLLADPVLGLTALRWYAKRAKLFAAFQKFVYQQVELDYASTITELTEIAKHFALTLSRYDFWDDTKNWGIIQYYGAAIKRFLESGNPGLFATPQEQMQVFSEGDIEYERELRQHLEREHILELWRVLAVLPRNYEEICREWFLPTELGFHLSYPPETTRR